MIKLIFSFFLVAFLFLNFGLARAANQSNSPPVSAQEEIPAWNYWYNKELDRLTSLAEIKIGGEVYLTGDIQKRHGRFPFKIKKSALNNIIVKSDALKEVVKEMVSWLVNGTDYPEFAGAKLRALTQENFTTASDWDNWFKNNSELLIWSEELNKFVIRK